MEDGLNELTILILLKILVYIGFIGYFTIKYIGNRLSVKSYIGASLVFTLSIYLKS